MAARCTLADVPAARLQEIPVWMLDPVACGATRATPQPVDRAFRQYATADPENRLVAGELEARWNRALSRVSGVVAAASFFSGFSGP